MERLGGVCNNWGCIPTKSLLRNAEIYHLMSHRAAEFGLKFDGLTFDWTKIIKRSRDVSDKGAAGMEFLFKKNKIDYIRGEATLDKAGEVKVKLADGKEETHAAPKILVATGVISRPLPGLHFNGKTVIGSREAMVLDPQPKTMIIIGAGAIGIEFAYFFNAFGTKVTVVEMMPNILPVEDTEVSQTLEKSSPSTGIKVLTNTKTTKSEANEKGVKITVEDAKGGERARSGRCARGDRRRAAAARREAETRPHRPRLHSRRTIATRPLSQASSPRAISSGRRGWRTSRATKRFRRWKECSRSTHRRKSARFRVAPIASRKLQASD